MKFLGASSPKASFREDLICGFFGGAMAGFNGGLWLFPHMGLLTAAQTLGLCIASGASVALFIARVRYES